MAETPKSTLKFRDGCPDCGSREAQLPRPLPQPGDDFDWLVRDYDGFRLFMMEELAARFSERRRWTPADMEVVIVETLSVVLDQLSDQMDRVASEAFLETARQPQSVRRLLKMIGYDAIRNEEKLDDFRETFPAGQAPDNVELLEQFWRKFPHRMEQARIAGPRSIRRQRRMVTEDDHADRLADHPIVDSAIAWAEWKGSWEVMSVAVRPIAGLSLDQGFDELIISSERLDTLREALEDFSREHDIHLPDLSVNPSLRSLLRPYVDAFRMAGKEICLVDAEPVGIRLDISLQVSPNYYQSEIRIKVQQALGTGVGGYFEPGRLAFGEDLHASNIFEILMELEGVTAVCLNIFKRIGQRYSNQADAGFIRLDGVEYAVCDGEPDHPERGYLTLKINGGLKG